MSYDNNMTSYSLRNINDNAKMGTFKRRQKWKTTTIVATLSFFAVIQSLFLETELLVDAFVSPIGKCGSGSQSNSINFNNNKVSALHVLQTSLREDLPMSPIVKNDGEDNVPPIVAGNDNEDDSIDRPFFSAASIVDGISEKIGRVENERIIFPEYENGEVTRVFSSLKYNRSDEENNGKITATHDAGSVFGGASLVAGTMVGAGILALPSATSPVGFIPSTGAMGIGWVYMTMSGLLIAELSINRLGQSGKPGQGMLNLYEDSLGEKFSKVGSTAYFGLHYCLLVAYIAQGGANLNAFFGFDSMGLPPGTPQAVFATIIGLGLYVAEPAAIEVANNVFVSILAVVFLGIIGLGAGTADFQALVAPVNQHPEKVVDALPIIFLSLVFHNVVPTVVNQLEGDRSKITKAIVYGTSVPTLMFVAWNAVVLGNVGLDASATGAVDPVALLQASASSGGSGAILGNLVTTFSSLALVTSLIGFVYGLLDGWTDVFGLPTEGPTYEKWKAPLFGLVFLPPLAMSLTDPDIFFTALDYGGAFGVSTLFLILPPIMVWKQRYGDDEQNLLTKPMGK
jgi:tyrosine-specific transport protein